MPTYKQFEELPAWNAATDLAVAVFKLTEAPSFRFKGDLVNQLRRAALSVANNIAEGFERGSTAELISFLYIARGSAGEVRSMLRFALRLGEMPDQTAAVEALVPQCESVSRQIRGWLDSLQNSDIQGQRHLNDRTRKIYEEDKRRSEFGARMAAFREAMEEQLRTGVFGTPDAPPLPSLVPDGPDRNPAPQPPSCPLCGNTMVRRTTRDGDAFWGCSAYPRCKGSRRIRTPGTETAR